MTKQCRDCKEIKLLAEFIKNKKLKSGIDSLCLVCNRKRVKEDKKKTKRRHSSKKRPSTPNIYREIILSSLIERDGFNCGICHKSLEGSALHFDHIIPVALGGKHILSNIQLTHANCNLKDALKIRKISHGF